MSSTPTVCRRYDGGRGVLDDDRGAVERVADVQVVTPYDDRLVWLAVEHHGAELTREVGGRRGRPRLVWAGRATWPIAAVRKVTSSIGAPRLACP